MKKILNVLIVFFVLIVIGIFNLTKVKAEQFNMLKKLFITVDSFDTLEYPGFKLIETNINYGVEGIYSATYLEDITDRKFIREIEVVSNDTLLNNGVKNINQLEEFKYENTKILKRVITNCCDVFVVESEDYVSLKFKYEDTVLDILLFNSNIFGFKDLVFNNDNSKLYLVGNLYTDTLDIYLAEYNLNGNLLKDKIVKGTNIDSVEKINISQDSIYLSGYTTSSDGDFIHPSYLEDSFVLKINLDTFEIIKYLNLGEVGIDYIKVSCYLDTLYVVKHYYTSGIPVVKIYKLDDSLNVLYETFLGTITLVNDVGLKCDDDYLYYFCNVYSDKLLNDETILYQISKDLQIKKMDVYFDPFGKAVDLNIVNEEISLLYTSCSKDENYPTYIRIISDNVIKVTLDNRIYDKCYFNELGNLDLIYKDCLKSFEYSLVYAKSMGSANYLDDVNPIIMCDNKEIEENKYLSNTSYDPNLYGVYNLVYYYIFDFYDLAVRKEIEVLSEVNIDDNNIYTKGLVLSFNGIGYLNNLIIEDGYKINSPGLYELKIFGNNDRLLTYQFEVKDVTYSKIKEEFNNYEFKIIEDKDNDNQDIKINNNVVENKIIDKNYQNNIWYIVIPIITLLISVTAFMFIGRKVK